MNPEYIKSPLNYIGGKYKILPQLFKFFPKKINTMVDLFAGGGDVFSNINAEHIIANDINYYVIDIFRTFQRLSTKRLILKIDETINHWHLSSSNKASFTRFRKYYNTTHNSLDLFVLVCYSFNYQFRFNESHEFNTPFGENRSWFNPSIRNNLIHFHKKLEGIEFRTNNFKSIDLSFLGNNDFVYADPPYIISTGSYNDGKRGFEGWGEIEEHALYNLLDGLDANGVKFALSNVIKHKGQENHILNQWRHKYHTHKINYDYSNSNYHANNTDKETREVLITNY